jgi:hypothetical protein
LMLTLSLPLPLPAPPSFILHSTCDNESGLPCMIPTCWPIAVAVNPKSPVTIKKRQSARQQSEIMWAVSGRGGSIILRIVKLSRQFCRRSSPNQFDPSIRKTKISLIWPWMPWNKIKEDKTNQGNDLP